MEPLNELETLGGFPASAMDFYAGLNGNNTREWWLANKDRYDAGVRLPLLALLRALEPGFGPGQIFRPYRDMRYFGAQGPFKTSQGAFVARSEGIGFYLEVDAAGLQVSAGCRSFPPAQLGRFRAAVDATASGTALAAATGHLEKAGFHLAGRALKTVPRGFPPDHPRAELLRYRTFTAASALECGPTPSLEQTAELVGRRWAQLRPLVDWLVRYAPA